VSLIKKQSENDFIEEEKLVLLDGQCFGEWGLIYKKERSASAFCLEDTDLFCLDASSFEYSFNVFYILRILEMHA
jgi:CRP-like cAMP-binding protein